MNTRSLVLIALLCLTIGSVQLVHANTVTSTNDSGPGSLRQALIDASDGDTIDFSVTGTIPLTSGELVVNKTLIISGPGANNLSVNGSALSRVFHVQGDVTATISGLTITNGSEPSNVGGGIYNESDATLTISNCTISGNYASDSAGGIWNDSGATLTINDSTVSGNSVDFFGGGIFNYGTMAISNCTISGNSAVFGGAMYNWAVSEVQNPTGGLVINNSTLSENTAPFGGGIYNDIGASLTLGGTILNAGASGQNVYNSNGTVISLGYNLSSDDAGVYLNQSSDHNGADPKLGPLQDNGGPTFTHALSPDSPAIDMGDPSFTPPPGYDQRGPGFDRVVNGRIDIGAFEVQTATIPLYAAQVRPPINADGTSVFNARRGVVPVKFILTLDGVTTCDLPPATIAVYRTGTGGNEQIDEELYTGPADSGSNFRISSCQYVYNLSANALGAGTYEVDILIDSQVVGSGTFQLR